MFGVGSSTCALQRSCGSLASEANFGVVRAADAKSVILEASRNASSGRAKGRVAGWAGRIQRTQFGPWRVITAVGGFVIAEQRNDQPAWSEDGAVGGCSDAVAAAVRSVRCVWARVEKSAGAEASISDCGGFLARDGVIGWDELSGEGCSYATGAASDGG
ncbi:hypothetical protein FGB62_249g04 [Gracilaria domingensis]|nr:hypothetical protein FGB62_249g04 [Gracilaria domingensis]